MGSERKVLNKYFPPDYDPSKIPRVKRIGGGKRQYNIRTMAPFNMRCNTCNGYIYKARKFNSRMEQAEDVEYLGLRHYRFFIRCSTCCAEIVWRTDIEKQDYVIESGAKRSFEALKTAEEQEAKRLADEEEEIANNPMKLMEKRTEQSRIEMENSEMLEDLRELNKRQAGFQSDSVLLRNLWKQKEDEEQLQKEADDAFIKECLEARKGGTKRLARVEEEPEVVKKKSKSEAKQLRSFNDEDEVEESSSVPIASEEPVCSSSCVTKEVAKRPPSFASLKKNAPVSTTKQLLAKAVTKVEKKEPTNLLGLDYGSSESD
ncbi:Coiled-coil domain-containing protein 94 [Cichlidogyrus casuarinus]|uniref:Splicing factor YJU2 n=1 Tax=Cichlidogyrus casuarinus TaxID=1844966 RepID=A0ABD2PU67_9PLAT